MLTAKQSAFALPILLVVSLLCSFLPAAASAGELHNVKRLVVVDADGKLVGEALDLIYSVAFKRDGKLFLVRLQDSSTFVGLSLGGWVAFHSNNCSGAAFTLYFPELVPLAIVTAPGMTVYAPDISAIPQEVSWNSRLYDLSTGLVECEPFSSTDLVVPAVPVVNLRSLFTPPFSVRGY